MPGVLRSLPTGGAAAARRKPTNPDSNIQTETTCDSGRRTLYRAHATRHPPAVLFAFGVGFLAANLKLGRRSAAISGAQTVRAADLGSAEAAFLRLLSGLGVVLGFLFAFKLFVQRRPPSSSLARR
jgi:hypothetical protein